MSARRASSGSLDSTTPQRAARRLMGRVARDHRGALGGAAGATVLVTLADLAAPWPLKWVIDAVVAGRTTAFSFTPADIRVLVLVAVATVGISLVNAVGVYTGDLWLRRAGERIAHDLRIRTYEQLQRLSIAFHDRRPKGDLVTRMTEDANRVGEIFSDSLGAIAQSLLMVVGMLALSVWLDPLLGLVLATVVPLLALVTRHFRREVRAAAKKQRARDGDIASLAAETLSSIRLVQASGTEAMEHEKVRAQSEARQRSGIEVAVIEARFAGFVDVIGAVAMAVVILLGSWRVSRGELSAGSLVVFAQYARRLYRPLKDIAKHTGRISKAFARAERIAEVLASDEQLTDRPYAWSGPRAHGDVALREVVFGYDPQRPVLHGVDLYFPAGSRTAIVGSSGAGKSTIGALVARFYDPTSGRVLLDGRELTDCSLRWIRSQVGILLQDTVLLTGTIAENIAYGTDATREHIVAAARIAGADDFISRLPDGYDHLLGANGVGLSGGQRQRLGIARVLLRDPAVLLLDEPTTGLDPVTEAEVMDGLGELMVGRTTIIVTHSVPMALAAEHVVVLDRGRVVEEGPPGDLLRFDGHFARLAGQQGFGPVTASLPTVSMRTLPDPEPGYLPAAPRRATAPHPFEIHPQDRW
ncbi:ABC transporter ATP-binding protein [Kineosporia sp. A_224]|uniref:ABC transporter ATP-binding protein n=1 Tax=Kineosporia sp. A_224 TaxID=1962180 RepID=UPI000B4B21EE|nr:ABC transporter ATP-binding protein [Kineosporia sp. A_224]